MDTRVSRYFTAAAQAESMRGAAQVLHTSQPNLSRQLGALEKEVCQKLFEKSHRKILLAEEGRFLSSVHRTSVHRKSCRRFSARKPRHAEHALTDTAAASGGIDLFLREC